MVLLLSTYDLGRQPFGLASPLAWLGRAGVPATVVDLSRDKATPEAVKAARLVALYLPMHTATRLALPVLDRIRAINADAVLCAFGLYAPLNEALLRAHGVTHILGPEFEADLCALATAVVNGRATATEASAGLPSAPVPTTTRVAVPGALARLQFIVPDRSTLPAPSRYASLQMPDGTRRVVGSTDATRGCKHLCRHCPIVPVYGGQFRVVPVAVVLADIHAQVAVGAQHITFGDPDFFNGPTHALRVVEQLHAAHPDVSYDVTIKVEHLLQHRALLPALVRTGCLFVTSAVESIDDEVLVHLDKGHTRADFVVAARLCREVGLTLVPTFVVFTPWTTLDGYAELLQTVADLDLIEHVAPVQWGIRLLVTWESKLLELPDIRDRVAAFDAHTLTYPWRHVDPRVDALQQEVMTLVGVRMTRPRHETFAAIRHLADRARGAAADEVDGALVLPGNWPPPTPPRATVPYLNEPWYC